MVDANVETDSPQACDVATMTDTVIGDDEKYAEYEQPCEYYADSRIPRLVRILRIRRSCCICISIL